VTDLLTAPRASSPPAPEPRGPLTGFLLDHLARPPHELPAAPGGDDDPLVGDDAQLALYLCYELHYRGLARVDEGWEWSPSLLRFRAGLETAYLERLLDEVGPPDAGGDVEQELYRIVGSASGPSLSRYLAERGTLAQLKEFAVHRSAYQLKEADPHTWALPRLSGAAKAAMVEIQVDEYGEGVEKDMHASLFATTMRELGLDAAYGAYLDHLPGVTLSTTNLATMFGLHRRWRGALVGHLAIFEMTSVEPMGRYSLALRRHGFGPVARHFYEVHVVADAHHEVVAARHMAGGLARQAPELVGDVLFGARAIMAVEERFARQLLDAFAAGRSSLYRPVPGLDAGAGP
jgi:hypothetical protein